MHLCTKYFRGRKGEFVMRLAAVAFIALMMAATLIPSNLHQASAADCPSGQTRNAQGECVPKINLGDGNRILDPDLIVPPTETPADFNPPLIDVDVRPEPTYQVDQPAPDINVND